MSDVANGPDKQQKLVLDVLLAMYDNETKRALHAEDQRSSISAILISLATALFGVIGGFWQEGPVVILAIALTGLGIFGFFISTKLFERSMLHFRLSDAYREEIEEIVKSDVSRVLPPHRVRRLPYVEEAYTMHERRLRGRQRVGDEESEWREADLKQLADNQTGENPRPTFVATHNINARWYGISWARHDVFRYWARLYAGVTILGIGILVIALQRTAIRTQDTGKDGVRAVEGRASTSK